MKNIVIFFLNLFIVNALWAQPGHDYYWVGTSSNGIQGSGSWNDLNAWRIDSINGTVPTQVPISSNTIYFMAGAFPTTLTGVDSVVINVNSNANCNSFYWDNNIVTLPKKIIFQTNIAGSTGPSNINLDIYGNFELLNANKLDFDFNGSLRFRSQDSLATIQTNGQKLLVKEVVFEGSDATEFRFVDFFHVDDPREYHYSLQADGGVCYFYRGYLNFNGQDAILDRFDALGTTFPNRRLNIAGSHIQLIGHSSYVWSINFNTGGTNYAFFNATGSHILVKEPTNQASEQRVRLGDISYDTITIATRYNGFIVNGSPTIQHLILSSSTYFYNLFNGTVENLYLYGNNWYRFLRGTPKLTVENVFVEAGCDDFAVIGNWQDGIGTIIKKTANTTLALNNVILNGVIGDISNGQSYVANNSVDAGGNTNWTINSSTTREMRFRYSNASATTHYWHTIANWEEWNGTNWVASNCLPTPVDQVYFDSQSYPATGNHEIRIDSTAYCHDIRWLANVDSRIEFNPNLSNFTTRPTLNIFGTMELDEDMSLSCTDRRLNFWGNGPDSIITNGVYVFQTLRIQPNAHYHIIDTLTARFLEGLYNSYISADNITMNLGRLTLGGRQLDSVDCHLTYDRAYPFFDYGGYQSGVSYTGTTTFHFWGDNRYYNCVSTANGIGHIYLSGSSCGGCTGAQPAAHFPNVIFHSELYGLIYHMTIHGDLTLMDRGRFHYWGNNPRFYSQLIILGDQPNGPYNGDVNLAAGKEYVFDSYYSNFFANTHPSFSFNSKIEITGTLNAIGTCKEPITLRTYTGRPMSLKVGAANIDYAFIEGLDNTGNPVINTTNSIDGGNNSNINFSTASTGTTLYWRAHFSDASDFEGEWNDPGHWTMNPSSLVGDSLCIPSVTDTVVFDALSFSVTSNGCSIDAIAFCKTIWIKADIDLLSTDLINPTGNLFVNESLLIDLPMTQYNYTGKLTFVGNGGIIRTSATPLVNSFLVFKSEHGVWDLTDDLTLQNPHNARHGILELQAGTLNTNNHTLDIYNGFYSLGTIKHKLVLGNSTVNLHCLGRDPVYSPTYPWSITGHQVEIEGENSILNFYDNNITGIDLQVYMGNDSLAWNVIKNNTNYNQNHITYGVVNFNGANQIVRVNSGANYQYLKFLGTAYLRGDNLMDSIEFTGGNFYYLHQNSIQYLNAPHGKIIANGSGASFINIETYPSGQTSYFHKEWGDYFCLDYIKVKDNEATRGINPNTGVADNDLYFYTGTNSDNINGTATGIWNFSLLFSTHSAQAPIVSVCDGQDSVDITVAITGNDYYDIRYNWYDSLGNTGADTLQMNDDDNDPNTPFIYTFRRPVLASGFYAFDIATFRCDKRTAAAIDTAWVYKNSPNDLVNVDRSASCYMTNKGTWVDFYDDVDAKPILSIQDSLGSADTDSLKNVNVSVNFDPTVQYHAGRPYLPRHWKVTPANNVGAKVRLYFTQAELDSLYAHTYHGRNGLAFGHSNAYLEVWKFDAVPHANAIIGSSTPMVVPHTVIPLTGTNRKALSSTADILAIEFEVSSFSYFILVPTSPVFLATDLLNFDAKTTTELEVELSWELANVDDSDYFEVLRSVDGINFEVIANLTATTAKSYRTLDETPLSGYSYYQLRIYNQDGSHQLSAVKSVYMTNNSMLEVYPNPLVGDNLTVKLSATEAEELSIQIINSLGQVVLSQAASVVLGRNEIVINTKSLGKGVYTLRLHQKNALIGQQKIIKVE